MIAMSHSQSFPFLQFQQPVHQECMLLMLESFSSGHCIFPPDSNDTGHKQHLLVLSQVNSAFGVPWLASSEVITIMFSCKHQALRATLNINHCSCSLLSKVLCLNGPLSLPGCPKGVPWVHSSSLLLWTWYCQPRFMLTNQRSVQSRGFLTLKLCRPQKPFHTNIKLLRTCHSLMWLKRRTLE